MLESICSALIKMDNKLLYILSIKIKNAFLDKIMPKITRCNDYGLVFLLFAAVIFRENNIADFLSVLLALTLGLICGEGFIKYAVKRERPLIADGNYNYLIKFPDSFSFPSGHTTSSFAVLGVVWYMNLQYKYLILVLAILISFSRIYLRVHYPSDIIGGIILGFLCAMVTVKISAHIALIKSLAANTPAELYAVNVAKYMPKCLQSIMLSILPAF